MELTGLLSLTSAALAVASFIVIARSSRPATWWLPAVPLAGFTAWSLVAVIADGPAGFWPEHVGTPWETQIWMDLLLMACAAWWLAQPRLRATGSSPWPWLALVLLTGSIGILCLLLWIRRAESSRAGPGPTG